MVAGHPVFVGRGGGVFLATQNSKFQVLTKFSFLREGNFFAKKSVWRLMKSYPERHSTDTFIGEQ